MCQGHGLHPFTGYKTELLTFRVAALAFSICLAVSTDGYDSNSSASALPNFTDKAETANFNSSTSTSWQQSKQSRRSTATSQASGRTGYEPISLASISSPLTGNDPKAVAVQAFKSSEPVSQRVEVSRPATNKAVVIVTQIGLQDDSVAGIRYRVELAQTGQQWKIVWVGSQVKCQSGRGHQNWSSELCS